MQRVTTLGLLLAAFIWTYFCLSEGHALWAMVGALTIVFGYAIVLGVEFALMGFVHKGQSTPRPSGRSVLKAWLCEAVNSPQVFCWRQPFRTNAEPDYLPQGATGQRGVLLVPGFVCNRAFWAPWMKRLRAAGIPFLAVDLEPMFGSIDSYSGALGRALRRLEAATGVPPLVVAHSMGGLAVRSWMRITDADKRVHKVITIGSPHNGTWLGRFGRTTNTRQMALGSPWLDELDRQESATRRALFICFYSDCDNVVFPPSSAMLEGADNRHLAGLSHVHMAFHEQIITEALRWLETPPQRKGSVREADMPPSRGTS
ncbi:MAG TPA: alpha/beta fold hydrolase [Burkholderiaceae bacterium]|nr:alpha/beta fold hydrolase [Burkholderiaceae bacterium]